MMQPGRPLDSYSDSLVREALESDQYNRAWYLEDYDDYRYDCDHEDPFFVEGE
jgi:hypothetical protein